MVVLWQLLVLLKHESIQDGVYKKKGLMRTGFEPATLTGLAPKASALDHSDTASDSTW